MRRRSRTGTITWPLPWIGLAVVLALLTAITGAGATAAVAPHATRSVTAVDAPPAGVAGPFAVTRVVDGDTVWVRIGNTGVKVRLIGIDTPETVDPNRPVGCFGPQASARAHALLDHQRVYLEYDPSQGRRDKYGRTLAYLWLPDGRLYNRLIIEEGLAREYTYRRPYAYQAAFRDAQTAAKAAGAGLWSACT